jgi:hypothetical protein
MGSAARLTVAGVIWRLAGTGTAQGVTRPRPAPGDGLKPVLRRAASRDQRAQRRARLQPQWRQLKVERTPLWGFSPPRSWGTMRTAGVLAGCLGRRPAARPGAQARRLRRQPARTPAVRSTASLDWTPLARAGRAEARPTFPRASCISRCRRNRRRGAVAPRPFLGERELGACARQFRLTFE